MAIRQVGERWYLYTGHFWHSGWSIVDVTDPAKPEVVKFVPYPGTNTWTLQIDLSGDTMVTALEKPFANFGGDPGAPFGEGVLIWDIADPINPKQLGHYRTGGNGTHRNLYPGGRYVHLAAGMPGYKGNIYVILDISDRSNPREAGRWWVPGQHEAGGESFPSAEPVAASQEASDRYRLRLRPQCMCGAFCASTGEDISLHGPPYVVGDLVYLPYGAAGIIVLDISDVSQPKQISSLSFSPPFHSRFGVHGVLPIPERGIAFANSENVTYGRGPMHHASIVDISDPAEPFLLSLLPEPVPPEGAPIRTSPRAAAGAGRTTSTTTNIIPTSRNRAICSTSRISTPGSEFTMFRTHGSRVRSAISFHRNPPGATGQCLRISWCCRPRMSSWIVAASSTSATRTRVSGYSAIPAQSRRGPRHEGGAEDEAQPSKHL